jgi:hypothetical protein
MDLAIYAYGISMGLISSILSILGVHLFFKRSIPLIQKWIYAGILSLGLGSFIGGVYFSLDVGVVPGVENPIALATLVSSCSGVFFTILLGLFRGLIYLLTKKKS